MSQEAAIVRLGHRLTITEAVCCPGDDNCPWNGLPRGECECDWTPELVTASGEVIVTEEEIIEAHRKHVAEQSEVLP